MPIQQEIVGSLTGEWQTGLFEAPAKAPLPFALGCCCPCFYAGQQRLQILDLVGEHYVCCAGLCPCGPLAQPQDRNCAYAESCCCTGLAISGNRYILQTRLDRKNTPADDCLLWTTCLAPWAVCLCRMGGVSVPREVENCVDCLQVVVAGCMLAQHQVEVEHMAKSGFVGVSPAIVAVLPPGQQQMIDQAKRRGSGVPATATVVGAVAGGPAGAGAMYSAAS